MVPLRPPYAANLATTLWVFGISGDDGLEVAHASERWADRPCVLAAVCPAGGGGREARVPRA
jgi:hypothetical protein